MEATMNFPFVAELPKREQSRLANLWDVLKQMKAVTDEKGQLVPFSFAAGLLGISMPRIDVLVEHGALERVDFNGHRFLTETSIMAYASIERKAGRPLKTASTKKEIWALARQAAEDAYKK